MSSAMPMSSATASITRRGIAEHPLGMVSGLVCHGIHPAIGPDSAARGHCFKCGLPVFITLVWVLLMHSLGRES